MSYLYIHYRMAGRILSLTASEKLCRIFKMPLEDRYIVVNLIWNVFFFSFLARLKISSIKVARFVSFAKSCLWQGK